MHIWLILDALAFHTCMPIVNRIHCSKLCDPIHAIITFFLLTKANCHCGSSKWIIYSIKTCKECLKNVLIRIHTEHVHKRLIRIGSEIIRLFIPLHFCGTAISASCASICICNVCIATLLWRTLLLFIIVPSINSERYYFFLLFPFCSVLYAKLACVICNGKKIP